MVHANEANRWLTLRLAGGRYAININNVRELISLKDVMMTRPPQMPNSMIGVAQVRDLTVGVLDLRAQMGLPSMIDANRQVMEMLEERKRDHVRWINELELSAREERRFTLAIDPHKCAFGRWYDQLMNNNDELSEFTNNDLTLLEVIEQFDSPHQRIHAIAEQVADLVHQDRSDEAQRLIQATRDTDLNLMVRLFDRCRALFNELRKGLLVIVEFDGNVVGALVDSVDEVSKFEANDIKDVPSIVAGSEGTIQGFAQTGGEDQLIHLLDVAAFAA